MCFCLCILNLSLFLQDLGAKMVNELGDDMVAAAKDMQQKMLAVIDKEKPAPLVPALIQSAQPPAKHAAHATPQSKVCSLLININYS